MILTYYGLQFFKFQVGDLTLAVNPARKSAGHKGAHFGADIALVTLNHPDMNGVEQLSYGERRPFVARGPGEYEVKGISVRGFPMPVSYGKHKFINTTYYFTFDSIHVLFLGALQAVTIDEKIRERVADVDILFVPAGGKEVLGPAEANKLSLTFSPKIIIPMQYDNAALKKFLDEAGAEEVKPVEKLTIKKKDLEGKEGEIIVLKAA